VNNSRWLVYNNKETYEKKAWVILLLRWQRIKCDKNAKITKPVLCQILLIRVSINAVKLSLFEVISSADKDCCMYMSSSVSIFERVNFDQILFIFDKAKLI
jgi:hypothetical protein